MHGTPNNLDHISAFYIGRQELTKTDKKKKYLIVYHKIGLVDACFTIQLFESLFSGCLQKVFIAVNHMCAFTSRSEMKHLTQGLCSSNALTFPKCSTNRSKNNSFITMPFHL